MVGLDVTAMKDGEALLLGGSRSGRHGRQRKPGEAAIKIGKLIRDKRHCTGTISICMSVRGSVGRCSYTFEFCSFRLEDGEGTYPLHHL
jgi:hypothetical protein